MSRCIKEKNIMECDYPAAYTYLEIQTISKTLTDANKLSGKFHFIANNIQGSMRHKSLFHQGQSIAYTLHLACLKHTSIIGVTNQSNKRIALALALALSKKFLQENLLFENQSKISFSCTADFKR